MTTRLAEALERLEAAVSPLAGIVTHTVSATHMTDESRLPNCASELASSVHTLGAPAVDWGSGAHPDPDRARAAALGEALERYSALYLPPDGIRLATAGELGPSAVDPARFALFHPAQLAMPGFPCAPFTWTTRTAWVEGTRLADGTRAFLPAELVYLTRPETSLRPIAYSTSNGLACAPTRLEATLAAALELIERDAVMIAWKCRLSLPLLDWSGDGELRRLEARYFAPSGLRFSVLDASHLLGVPVAVAILHGAPGSGAALAMGAGAGASIGDAWLKALGEAFGVFRWLRSQAEPSPSDPGAVETFADHMRFYADDTHAAQAAFLDASAERTATADVPPLEGTTVAEQLAAVVGRLDDGGLTGYAVDVTSPDVRSLGLAVVRVIVPELCPLDVSHRARFLGGRRLTHAAYEAGLLAAPLRVLDLNPLPHPFP